MVIRNINLETVCGITSKLPENDTSGDCICRKIQRRKVIPDQCAYEPEIITREYLQHRERHRRSTFIISMKNYIW